LTVNPNVGLSSTANFALSDTQGMSKQRTPHAIAMGQRVKKLRKALDLVQAQLAEQIGVERGTLAGIEVGAYQPGRSTLAALAGALGVSMDYLEFGTTVASDDEAAQGLKAKQNSELFAIWTVMDPAEKSALLDYLERMFGGRLRATDRHEASSAVNVPGT
jgi:transcriptional regulator with XRE-family HTH domain